MEMTISKTLAGGMPIATAATIARRYIPSGSTPITQEGVDAVVYVQDKPGMRVLEPSAGTGRLAEAARAFGGVVTCVELLPKNVQVLVAKGFPTIKGDFLAIKYDAQVFDRVLMNPPFAKRADIHHIRHAFGFLKPGGRLVSIASKSVEFRIDKLATEFRAWAAEHNGTIEPLPEGAFKESGTMVNTVLVTMNK